MWAALTKKRRSQERQTAEETGSFFIRSSMVLCFCAVMVTDICTCIKGKISSSIQQPQLKNPPSMIYSENTASVILSNDAKNSSEYALFRIHCTSSTFCFCVICSWRRLEATSFLHIYYVLFQLFPVMTLPLTFSLAKCVHSLASHLSKTQEKQNTWQPRLKKSTNLSWKQRNIVTACCLVWRAEGQRITSPALCGLWLPPSSKDSQPICGSVLRKRGKGVGWVGGWRGRLSLTLA